MLRSLLTSRARHAIFIARKVPVTGRTIRTYRTRIQQLHHDGIDYQRQSIEINPIEHIRRCTFYKDLDISTLYKTICPNVHTLGDVLDEGRMASNDGPCVGLVPSPTNTEPIQWLSYSTAIERSRLIGSYLWTRAGLQPTQSRVAIMSANRPEYMFVEHACYMYGFILINLYTSYDRSTIMNLLERTQAEVLVVDDIKRIQSFETDLLNNKQLKKIIFMNDFPSDEQSQVQSISSILKTSDIRERPTIDPNSTATFIMTSGTTGEPKVAMLSHENLLAASKGNILRLERANLKGPVTLRHCSILPLAHIFERFILLGVLLRGNQVVFCPTPEKMIDYFSIVKPTQLTVVPRILNKIHDTIIAEVSQSKLKQYLVQQALRTEESWWFSRLIFGKVKNLFGGELRAMFVGAAPITRDVLHFFRVALDIPVMSGYGQTESTACATSSHAGDTATYDHIGSPVATVEIKLIDVPGTDYRSDRNQGEICIRGPVVFQGYYNDEAKTRETVDENGWLHTGDVAEWTSNGTLRMIDRTKHIFKLNQGTYIAPERLEEIYSASPWITQSFVDGISTEATVVAVVIPDEAYVRKNFPMAEGRTTAELCKDGKLKEMILSDLTRLAKDNKLKYFETVSNIHLHPEPFSVQNGLLTVTLKTRRTNVQKHFRTIIQSLYDVKKNQQ